MGIVGGLLVSAAPTQANYITEHCIYTIILCKYRGLTTPRNKLVFIPKRLPTSLPEDLK